MDNKDTPQPQAPQREDDATRGSEKTCYSVKRQISYNINKRKRTSSSQSLPDVANLNVDAGANANDDDDLNQYPAIEHPKTQTQHRTGLNVDGDRGSTLPVCNISTSNTSLPRAPRTPRTPRTTKGTATAALNIPFSTIRSTRSSKPQLFTSHEWEAIHIERSKNLDISPQTPLASGAMSRNRPRGPPTTRENGLPADEEVEMWNKIRQDVLKAKEKNDKQKTVGQQIATLNEKIAKNGNRPSLAEIDQLDQLHRQQLKLAEEEKAILQEEPADVLKNLGILIALRSASEADPQARSLMSSKPRKRKGDMETTTDSPAASVSGVSDKLNRIKNTQRSTSASSSQARESLATKADDDGSRGTAAERTGQFYKGAEVVYKHNKKQGAEGEGIQCIIKNITGDGSKRRYDVQDPEPNENGEEGAVYKTTAVSLIPIPRPGTPLPQFQPGKQVLARYPDTTTFYRAEVMGSKKDVYRLKFEGEEDDKEMDVDRRFVLDIHSK